MAFYLRSVSNKCMPVNQFIFPGKLLGGWKLRTSFKSLYFIEFVSKRGFVACSAATSVRQKPYLHSATLTQWKEEESCIRSSLNIYESHRIENQWRRKDVTYISFNEGILKSFPSGIQTTSKSLSHYEKGMVLLAEISNKDESTPPGQNNNNSGKPTEHQLRLVLNVLSETLPKLFIQSLDYSIYHPNIVFENNIKGTRTVGLHSYIKQVAWLRTVGHFKFGFVKFDILKITLHPEDGTVRLRWRIRGISGLKAFFYFWKFKIWELKEVIQREEETWYDGFSTFYIGGDGLVHKHVADKMQPDDDKLTETKQKLDTLGSKLALMLGLSSQELADFSHFLFSHKQDITIDDKNLTCYSDLIFPLDEIE